jgi:hypothetical protein
MAAAGASALVGLQSGVAFAADAITVSAGSDTAFTAVEGTGTGTKEVATFTDSGNPPLETAVTAAITVTCDSLAQARYTATIDWKGDGTETSAGTVRCTNTPGTWAVWGAHSYKDSGIFDINVTVTDKVDDPHVSGTGTATAIATITDAPTSISVDGDNSTNGAYTAVEGTSVTVAVDFFDNNRAFGEGGRDAGISGKIDWGDGTIQNVQAVDATGICDCNSNDSEIRGSHVYDAAIPATALYHIVVTATDDGGATAAADFVAAISDGALTAGSDLKIATAATSTFSVVVGSFTDAAGAQAAVSDFVATINWGDNTTSAGTVTQTGSGAFNVDGSHAYATTGTKNITATVTDEEGSTVTLKETATVGAAPVAPVAPVVLPATGQPHQPSQPAMPLIPLALLALGLVGLATGGRILAKTRR